MAGKQKEPPGLLSQYADLREDDDEEGLELLSPESLEATNANHPALPVNEDGALSDCDQMSEGSVVESTWFSPNGKTGSKRLRGPESGSLGSLLEPSKKVKAPLHPTNKTLDSQGSGLTILVAQEPEDCGEYMGSSSKRLSQDPLGIARALKSLLDFSSVKDVRINGRRNLLAVEFVSIDASERSNLLEATRLGKYAVHCYRPSLDHHNVSWGVIHNVTLDENLEELRALISCDAFPVLKIVRLNKFTGGSKQPSTSVKIGFAGNSIPKYVQIDFLQVPVKPFVDPPLRCYRCQRPGHLASGCTAAIRCLVCAGNHTKDSCTSDKPFCANCKGDHVASSRSCRIVLEGLKIQGLVKEGLTYGDARKRVRAELHATSGVSSSHSGHLVRIPSAMPGLRGPRSPQRDLASASCFSPVAASGGLETIEVAAEVHQTQGSYVIPRRYPRQHQSYATALLPSQVATQDLLPEASALPSTVLASTPLTTPHPAPAASPLHQAPIVSSVEDSVLEKCLRHLDNSIESLFSRLSKFLLEVFSANLSLENKRQRELLLISMVRNHFGPTVGDNLLSSFHKETSVSEAVVGSASAAVVVSASAAVVDKPLTRSSSLPRKSKGSSDHAHAPPSAKVGKGSSKKLPPSSSKASLPKSKR